MDPNLTDRQRRAKTIMLAREAKGDSFNSMVELLLNLTKSIKGSHFLAFADSRRMVEQVVAATHRKGRGEDEDDDVNADDDSVSASARPTSEQRQIMPFRAGYEAEGQSGDSDRA